MAVDFKAFDEGSQYLLSTGDGLPPTCYFLLSTHSCNGAGGSTMFSAADTLAGGVGEITGTGYTRQSQAAPTPAGSTTSFAQMVWNTGTAANWPEVIRAVVMTTTVDDSGVAICAWNLVEGGTSRDLSQPTTIEHFTPTLITTS